MCWRRWLTSAVVLAVLVFPAVADRDSYPLSTYPVYATAREQTGVVHTAVGIADDGEFERLTLGLIADTDDPLIAEERVADAVRQDRADALCTTIASRVARSDRGSRFRLIEVVTERLDFVLVAAERAAPLSRTVHAQCAVPT